MLTSMQMEIERAVGAALPSLASLLAMPIPQEMINRMLIAAMSPLGEGSYDGGGRGFVRAVFPASAAAVAGLEKRMFVAGGGDDGGRCGASGCSICMEEFEDGEEVSVITCSCAHEFHENCIAKWLGMRNTCPLCRRGLPTDSGVARR